MKKITFTWQIIHCCFQQCKNCQNELKVEVIAKIWHHISVKRKTCQRSTETTCVSLNCDQTDFTRSESWQQISPQQQRIKNKHPVVNEMKLITNSVQTNCANGGEAMAYYDKHYSAGFRYALEAQSNISTNVTRHSYSQP